MVGATVVVVVAGALVVVVVGALVVVVVAGALVVVVVGALVVVVVAEALVVVVVTGTVVELVVVEGDVVVEVPDSSLVDGTGLRSRKSSVPDESNVTSPEKGTVDVVAGSGTSGLSAACAVGVGESSWLPMARAVPPMMNMAMTIANMVAVRVLKRFLRVFHEGIVTLCVFLDRIRCPRGLDRQKSDSSGIEQKLLPFTRHQTNERQ